MRAVAVDWSGARSAAVQRRAIWIGVAVDGVLVSLGAGRTAEETVLALLDLAGGADVIGLDFSFSFPEWWVREVGATDGPSMWEVAAACGEGWLSQCEAPFWGRPGRRRPATIGGPAWRRTELAGRGPRPKSTFQVGGAGSVGTGSIRGMAGCLRPLRAAGLGVWPFDRVAAVGEVYPRWCTGPVVKSRPACRAAELDRRWPRLPGRLRELAVASEDAFDAACTALTLSCEWSTGVREPDHVDRMEGRILDVGIPGGPERSSARPPSAQAGSSAARS